VSKRSEPPAANRQPPAPVEVIILAGGLSTRMGRDKARLRLGGRSMLAWVRAAARATGWPVRVVRRDAVPRCGPLGGVWTAFRRSRAERLVFLSCDMPFVTADLIRAVAVMREPSVFTVTTAGAGFPFALDRAVLPQVRRALAEERFSLQAFARDTHARRHRPPRLELASLANVNTPADLARAAQRRLVPPRRVA
jgi:molybdopterin-guanine dinucleotide biosynthesis protein A